METIDIINDDETRQSHFQVHEQYLQVSGNLPHGYKFKPLDVREARHLIEWLENWIEN